MKKLYQSGALAAALIAGTPGIAAAAFSGPFAVAGWTLTDADGVGAAVGGSVTLTDAPASITLTGGDQAVSGDTDYTILITVPGTLRFDWSYVTSDLWEIALNDPFGYLLNDAFSILPDTSVQQGQQAQTGTASLWVWAGDRFGFRISTDGYYGPAAATVSNLEFAVPTPASWALLALGLGLAGTLKRRGRQPETPI